MQLVLRSPRGGRMGGSDETGEVFVGEGVLRRLCATQRRESTADATKARFNGEFWRFFRPLAAQLARGVAAWPGVCRFPCPCDRLVRTHDRLQEGPNVNDRDAILPA